MRFLFVLMMMGLVSGAQAADCVVLLHGLARSSGSMATMEQALVKDGYKVMNLDYPAREKDVEGIVVSITPALMTFTDECEGSVHFVTHSMGGLVARAYVEKNRPTRMGRMVMLGPPNQGSEVADFLKNTWFFKFIGGPAGQQLVTVSPTLNLGVVDYPVGVVSGDRSVNLISSWFLLPGPDDGKVTVSRTTLVSMTDQVVLHTTHVFMMNNPIVVSETLGFLATGRFGK